MTPLKANKKLQGQVLMPVHLLYPIANTSQVTTSKEVKDSIYVRGMEFPVILYPISIKDWREEKRKLGGTIILDPPPLDDYLIVMQVRCGNQRVRYAKELGYTHIDSIILESKEEIATKMKEQSDWFKGNKP